MADVIAISRTAPPSPAQDFAMLREAGLGEIQRLGADSWTDHNLHDPGITILEAFCYAMTELGLKLELDVRHLIASGARRAAPALPPASAVLPCAAVTAEDLRRQLLDHYLVGDARISGADRDRVAYYEDQTADPPLAYAAPTTDPVRITPRGLYDVLLAFDDPLLNANTYPVDVTVGPNTVGLEIALPHWDEPEAAPFLGGGLTLTGAALTPLAAPWHSLELDRAWFSRVDVSYTGPGGAATDQLWVVMRISSSPDIPASSIPPILTAAQAAVESIAAGSVLEQFLQRVADANAAAATVRRDLRNWRNLAEEAVALSVSRVQEIAVNARIEVTRTTGLEELLAAILYDIDLHIAPPFRFADPAHLTAEGMATEDILDGPLLTHGIPAPLGVEPILRGDTIFLSDVLNLLMQPHPELHTASNGNALAPRDVIGVTELSLSNFVNNRVISSGVTGCQRLIEIDRHRPRLSIAKSRIVLVHDDIEAPYDLARVIELVEAARADDDATARLAEYDPEPAAPEGEVLAVGEYHPFQFDLPSIYGVTEAGLPPSATVERRQQALQLRAYLLVMEQFLADATEQLAGINRLFSPDASEATTYATRALLGLDDMERLVAAFPGGSWTAFASDPNNAYAVALMQAAENQDTALDRRNRMLDHLLGRHGEDMISWAQDLNRWGQKSVVASSLPPATLPGRIAARRLAVNRRLLRAKSDYLADIPRLHALRLLALGGPMQWLDDLVTVARPAPGQFTWQIVRGGVPVFEGIAPAATRGEALTRARDALYLATTTGNYGAQNFGGANNRRYILRADPAAPPVARSASGFPTFAAASAAAAPVRADLISLTRAQSRTAMERRVDHQIGVRDRLRRRLVTPLADFFEVFDDGPPFTKRWRLWSAPGFAGDMLIVASATFAGPVEATAIAAAEAAIEAALEVALDEWNWRIDDSLPVAVTLELLDADEAVVAAAPAPFASRADAEAARDRTIAHLYGSYSAEGFHMLETLLLRPQATGEPFLDIPASETQALSDPYSQRLVIILPSGWQRNFALGPDSRTPARPHRFRDPEFHRHAERMIRQSCPAHITPEIRWVDRAAPGTPTPAGSFERFERRYFNWLDTLVLDGFTAAAAATRRGMLVQSVNAIVNG